MLSYERGNESGSFVPEFEHLFTWVGKRRSSTRRSSVNCPSFMIVSIKFHMCDYRK